jgi:ferredoxin
MRIRIDRERCIGSGDCAITAAEVFGQDAEGIAMLIGDATTAGLVERANEAVENCPSGALSLDQEEDAS